MSRRASAHGTRRTLTVTARPPATAGAAPDPSLLATLRMLVLFRRMPSQRYDFTKPEA